MAASSLRADKGVKEKKEEEEEERLRWKKHRREIDAWWSQLQPDVRELLKALPWDVCDMLEELNGEASDNVFQQKIFECICSPATKRKLRAVWN